jgi:hypothetical protein
LLRTEDQLVRFLTYQEWKPLKAQRMIRGKTLVVCPECDGEGSGDRDCECSCGHTHTRQGSCDTCEDGEVLFSELTDPQQDKVLSVAMYEKDVIEDAEALASWLTRDLYAVLVDSGFQPWMDARKYERRLHLLPHRYAA